MMRTFASSQGMDDIIENYASISNQQDRLKLLVQSAFGAFMNPERADLVSATADLSSHRALERLEAKMNADPEGA